MRGSATAEHVALESPRDGAVEEREPPLTTPGAIGHAVLVERAALASALVPLVVAVVRAGVTGWMPLFDAGYFAVRSRDVLTSHHPYVGAWSMGSRSVGVSLNNLGPLQLDLLAPFTKIWPYWGTAVGTAAINAAAVVGVWLVARRLFGVAGAVGAMIATLTLEVSMGSWNLVEPRQQLALLLPFWCLLWLCAALVAGWIAALPWTVLVASLVVQTHFTYIPQTLVIVLVGASGVVLAIADRRRRAKTRPALLAALAVGVVCWAQPLWDQFVGTGNLGAVLGESGGRDQAVGWTTGVRFLAATTLAPPFFLPGHMGEFLRPRAPVPSAGVAWAALAVWLMVTLATIVIGWRTRRRPVLSVGAIGAGGLVGAAWAASMIPPTIQFGIVPYNYYWMWPIAIFAATAAVAGAVAAARHLTGAVSERARGPLLGIAVAACAVLAAIAVRPIDGLPETEDEPSAGGRVGRELLGELRSSLDRLDVRGPVVIDLERESFANHFTYTMLAELQRRGVGFTFPPGDVNRARFGRERCEHGTSPQRLVLADGAASLAPGPDEIVLAQVDGLTPAEHGEHTALEVEFGDLLRDGTIAVNLGAFPYFGIEIDPRLAAVYEDEHASAAGLADYLNRLQPFGLVKIPEAVAPRFAQWQDLERRLVYDRVAIFLAPNLIDHDRCDTVAPGAGIIGD
jgi:hypothetical protein